MSYDVQIYHVGVKQSTEAGLDLDAFEHPRIPPAELERLCTRLLAYGYELERATAVSKEYVKRAGTCPIQVVVFETEIGFCIPYWNDSDAAIMVAIQDATELSDAPDLAVFDPQTGEWLSPADD